MSQKFKYKKKELPDRDFNFFRGKSQFEITDIPRRKKVKGKNEKKSKGLKSKVK